MDPNFRRSAMRFMHLFCLGLAGGPATAAELVAMSGPEPFRSDMAGILARARVEGEGLTHALREYADRLDYRPLSVALRGVLEGGDIDDVLITLRNFVRSETDLESKELTQRIGLRLTAAFSAMTVLATGIAVGSIPPDSLALASAVIAAPVAALAVRRWLAWRGG